MIINVSFVDFPIYIQFRHHQNHYTECALLKYEKGLNAEEMEVIAEGYAIKHPNDKPDKEKGRKVALADAMNKVTLTAKINEDGSICHSYKYGFNLSIAANRREIWNAYHSRSPKYASYINHGKAA